MLCFVEYNSIEMLKKIMILFFFFFLKPGNDEKQHNLGKK